MAKGLLITQKEKETITEVFKKVRTIRGTAREVKRDPQTIRTVLNLRKNVTEGCFNWKDFNNSIIL